MLGSGTMMSYHLTTVWFDLIWFDSLSEKEKCLPHFCMATLTYLISFPSHHSCRLSHTTEDRRKYQSSSGDLRDLEPVTLYKVEAFHVCCCAVLFPEMSSSIHWPQSHARQWLKHKSLVPKADVHQLFFTRRSDINSLLETVERCKGTEETKLWSVREEDGVCILVVKVLLQWLVLDSWGPGYWEKRAQTETDVEDVLVHRERRDGDMKREEVTKGA